MSAIPKDPVELIRLMKSLEEHPGFSAFKEYIEIQVKGRYAQLLHVPQGLDSVLTDMYTKGEIAGLRLLEQMPQIVIDHAQAQKEINEAIENGGENTEAAGRREEAD